MCIEAFHEGVRITATDSYLLLTGWVPNVDHPFAGPPGDDEAPYSTAVAMDPHGRARGLLHHARGLVAEAVRQDLSVESVEVSLRLGVVDEIADDDRVSFEGMDPAWVVLEIPDKERVKLRTFEGEFPSWRKVMAGFKPRRTGRVALAPQRVEQLAKLSKFLDDVQALRFEFGGESKSVRLHVSDSELVGLVMPVRWDFDTDAPRDDDTDDGDDG